MAPESIHKSGVYPRGPVLALTGATAICVGLVGIAFGSIWADTALEFFASHSIASPFDLIVPFMPILLIAGGSYLVARSRR